MSFLIRVINSKTGHEIPGTSRSLDTSKDAIDHIRTLRTQYQDWDQFDVRVLVRGSTSPQDFNDLKSRADAEGFHFDAPND